MVWLSEVFLLQPTIQNAIFFTYNFFKTLYYIVEWELANKHSISEISCELVVPHWDSSQSGWTLRDIFIANNLKLYNIGYLKYFLWGLLQNL